MKHIKTDSKTSSVNFNKIGYGAFVIIAAYFLISGDLSSFCIQFGIALVFDPFDQKVVWKDRPVYQRAWMIVHLIILFSAFFILLFKK